MQFLCRLKCFLGKQETGRIHGTAVNMIDRQVRDPDTSLLTAITLIYATGASINLCWNHVELSPQ